MSSFNEDRATLNVRAAALDAELATGNMDSVIQKAFEDGMEIDEIMYVIFTHTEKTLRRYVVQEQLKKAANKDR